MIRIHGIDWLLRVVTPKLSDPNTTIFGVTDFHDAEINIRSGLPKGRTEQVFFHELLHVLLYQEDEAISPHMIEGVVSRVSVALYGVLSDNGVLSDGWFDGLVDSVDEDEIDSKRVIVDHDPTDSDSSYVPVRTGNHAEALSASRRNHLEGSSE